MSLTARARACLLAALATLASGCLDSLAVGLAAAAISPSPDAGERDEDAGPPEDEADASLDASRATDASSGKPDARVSADAQLPVDARAQDAAVADAGPLPACVPADCVPLGFVQTNLACDDAAAKVCTRDSLGDCTLQCR
jgi:hypothetical protein